MPRKMLKYVQKERSRHGETKYYYRKEQSGRVRLPDEYGTTEFLAAYSIAAVGGIPEVAKNDLFSRRRVRTNLALRRSLEGCKARAKARWRDFELTADFIERLAKEQNYRCAITGIPFDLKSKMAEGRRNPFAPSIDRIDSRGGYVEANVRIVALAVNIMLADWGEPILRQVMEAYRDKC